LRTATTTTTTTPRYLLLVLSFTGFVITLGR
jgi:hypothetical protein